MGLSIPSVIQTILSKLSGEDSLFVKDLDMVSKLSYQTSPVIIGAGLLVISYMQFVDKPMSCFYSESRREWERYINDFCWLESYYHPAIQMKHINSTHPPSRELDSTVYHYATFQWVPFVLILQIILFCIPHMIWNAIFLRSPLNPSPFLQRALLLSTASTPEDHQAKLEELQRTFKPFIENKSQKLSEKCKSCCAKNKTCNWNSFKLFCKNGCQRHRVTMLLTSNFLLKLLYIGNAIGQNILTCYIFNMTSIFYGINVLHQLYSGHDSEMPQSFPRVLFCNIVLKDNTPSSIPCTIKLNMFNEKFYTFLWFWCFGLAILGVLVFIYDIIRQATLTTRIGFIYKDLKLFSGNKAKDTRLNALAFARKHIRTDGIYLLDLIHSNISKLVVGEVVIALWREWVDHESDENYSDTSEESIDEVPPELFNLTSINKSLHTDDGTLRRNTPASAKAQDNYQTFEK